MPQIQQEHSKVLWGELRLPPVLRRARQIHDRGQLKDWVRRARYLLRALLSLRTSLQWDVLLSRPSLRVASASQPRLFEKLQRPYLHRSWSMAQRYAALAAHYRWLSTRFDSDEIDALYTGNGLCLAVFTQPEALGLSLWLRYEGQFEREGELALSLRIPDGRDAVTLAFTVREGVDGLPELLIGSMQTRRLYDAGDPLELHRRLTAVFHGLRPKSLLVEVVRGIGRAAGASQLLAIADSHHVSRSLRQRLRRQHRVSASYDELWSNAGGVPADDGFYTLALSPRRREGADIPAKKRAQYRRRYQMLDELSAQIDAFMRRRTGRGSLELEPARVETLSVPTGSSPTVPKTRGVLEPG